MRTRIVVAVLGGALAAVLLVAGSIATGDSAEQAGAPIGQRVLFGVLTGPKEVDADGNKGGGDRNGRGSFTATLDAGQLCFGITAKNIGDPVASHIHRGGPNVAGPVVVELTEPSGGDPGSSSGCVDVAGPLGRAILRNPKRYYANVHNQAFPGGAIRGQLFQKSR
jgi:hypothetical protein